MRNETEGNVIGLDAKDGVEFRRAARKTVLKKAKIIYNDGHCTADCTVRNLSRTGARLELATHAKLPDTIILRFLDGRKRPAEVIWATMTKLGVHFLDLQEEDAIREIRAALLERIRTIEEQLNGMRDALLLESIRAIEEQLDGLRDEILINMAP